MNILGLNENAIEIIKCALDIDKVQSFNIKRLNNINYDELVGYCFKQQLLSITSLGLENISKVYPNVIDDNTLKQLINFRYQTISKITQLDNEREMLLKDFEESKIWYLPLKGIIMKDLYPSIGIREMCDNDILFDGQKAQQVKEIFLNHGYESIVFGMGHHDTYHKLPAYNFEMHLTLTDESLNLKNFNEYYKDPFKVYD